MKKLNIVVVGTLASDPYAGMAWMHMQIVVGLQRLGHNVWYFEITRTWPYNPVQFTRVNNPDFAVPYLKNIMHQFGMEAKWGYRCSFLKSKKWIGIRKGKAEDILANADFIFNISGATRIKKEKLKVGRLVYFGTDPVHPEIKYSQGDSFIKTLIEEHDDTITYGENIGNNNCPIPPLPNMRSKIRQPILTDYWTNNQKKRSTFTTVGNFKQGGRDLVFKGETYYWSKHHEFLKFIDVPKRVNQRIELAMNLAKPESFHHRRGTVVPALGVAIDEYTLLTSNGWKLTDGPSFSTDPWAYRNYIIKSKGEFTFAKDQNIRLRSGWFSERSACYLAAGRPVITQDTAFDCTLPTGLGLFAFNNMEDISTAFEAINSNYKKHSNAAKEIAEEYFKAEKVLDKLLKDLGA